MPSTKITALPVLPSANVSANGSNTIFVIVDLSTGTATTKQLSLANLDIFIDNVGSVAFAHANGAFDHANGAFTQANIATPAFAHANGAFAQANTANTTAEASFAKANTANTTADASFAKANSANVLAQNAYNAANSANTFDFTNIATSPGFYGDSISVTSINLAANGRVISASNIAITGFANSTYATSAYDFANTTANLVLTFSASTILDVSANSSIAYNFSQYANGAGAINNPNVSTFSATTIGFNLNPLAGAHPFHIRLGDNSADFSNGLVHISSTGTLSYDAAAQGKVSGTLLWRIPHDAVGNYKYRCSSHAGVMIGEINVANTANIYFAYST
jgi:hypothetical protein